jgi:hypothetical protein
MKIQPADKNKTSIEDRWIYLLHSCKITSEIRNLKRPGIQFLDNSHTPEFDERVVEPLLAYRSQRGRA